MHFITSILTLSVIITPLIILHEFAHFLTAKLFKVKIMEFGIGFPPRIYGFWTNEQEYSISPDLNSSLPPGKIPQQFAFTNDSIL